MIKVCMYCGRIVTEEDHRRLSENRGLNDKYCPHCERGTYPYVEGQEALKIVTRKIEEVDDKINKLDNIKYFLLESERKLNEESKQ